MTVTEMKMTDDDYQKLRDALTVYLALYKTAMPDYEKAGLTPKRFRWDCLWKSGLRAGDGVGIKTTWNVYAYLSDAHIDTALRQAMKELGLDWAANP